VAVDCHPKRARGAVGSGGFLVLSIGAARCCCLNALYRRDPFLIAGQGRWELFVYIRNVYFIIINGNAGRGIGRRLIFKNLRGV